MGEVADFDSLLIMMKFVVAFAFCVASALSYGSSSEYEPANTITSLRGSLDEITSKLQSMQKEIDSVKNNHDNNKQQARKDLDEISSKARQETDRVEQKKRHSAQEEGH